MKMPWNDLKKNERGANLTEYSLLVALIGLVCVASLKALGLAGAQTITKSAAYMSGPPNATLGVDEGSPSTNTNSATDDPGGGN